jgi:hypothetical protein
MEKATYFKKGFVRSRNASVAEQDGKLPITRAVKILAKRCGVTQKKARAVLEKQGPSEWHHVGKFAQQIDYYDVEKAALFLSGKSLL